MGSLFPLINSTFCVVVVLSNILSAQLIRPPFFDHLAIPAGLFTYPFTFFLSSLATELYGAKKARTIVYTSCGMSLLSFVMIHLVSLFPTSDQTGAFFLSFLDFSKFRIFCSLVSYVISQLIEIQVYVLIKKWTGPKWLWMRNNGSTLVSQLSDTILIDLFYLYGGLGMALEQVWPIILFSYLYKSLFTLLSTPFLYFILSFFNNKRGKNVKKVYL